MRISVVMIDGQFREHTYSAEYFCKQNFPESDYEVIWVEYYSKVPAEVEANKRVKIIRLGNPESKEYHSSYCFNAGIAAATGELIIIPDADQIVAPDFLQVIHDLHAQFEKLVVYPYRYDELQQGALVNHSFDELEKKCVLKNPLNYGGCLTVRKKWLMELNGYEQHMIFSSGFHANGSDMYTRFKNLGLAIMWTKDVKLYHPWHPFTLAAADQYTVQLEFVEWRKKSMEFKAISGIDTSMNSKAFDEAAFMKKITTTSATSQPPADKGLLNRLFGK